MSDISNMTSEMMRPLTAGELLRVRRAINAVDVDSDSPVAAVVLTIFRLHPDWESAGPGEFPPRLVQIPRRQADGLLEWCRVRVAHLPDRWLHELLLWVNKGPSTFDAEWTAADDVAAEREGWAIFDSHGSENGPWQLQQFDDPTNWDHAPDPYPFETDQDVWEHVAHEAGFGSALHLRALEFIGEHNPMEKKAIDKHLAKGASSDKP